ncbi:MAG: exodeoxyribonuclease I [Reinekea sp.]
MSNNTPTEPTLLWYDYETWGANPIRDRLAQFAAIRTDLNLNPIEEPINLLCKPACDTIIDPEAVTITGLSPLTLSEEGMNEWDFANEIEQHFSKPGTCTTGYNTIRFDDECTRFLFYRNLIDPYAREWKNGNSRWDLLDVMRMARALRPDGIEWPVHEDGSPSFKLEHLTAANGLSHEHAHDAVSDVKATIALAKLLKQHQPKLFDYAFTLRSKHQVRKHLNLSDQTPHLHFSGKIAAKEFCMGIEIPLLTHPDRANEVIVIDIRQDPSWLLHHDAETIKNWLYSKTEDLPEGIARPPLRTIHLNRSPMIAPMSLLDNMTSERLSIDKNLLDTHARFVHQHPELNRLALDVFTAEREHRVNEDPEQALYEGFIDDHDRNLLNRMRKNSIRKSHWLDEADALHDDRLPPLLNNILARHFPDVLTEAQLEQWQKKRRSAMSDSGVLSIDQALEKIPQLQQQYPNLAALQDTQHYLLSLKNQWFGVQASNTPQDQQMADIEHNDSDDTSVLTSHQQMDLF